MTSMTHTASARSDLPRRFATTTVAVLAVIVVAYAMRGISGEYHTPEWAVWVHLGTAIPALPLGAYVLWGPKGTPRHKALGRIWVALMMVTAIDSFWIRSLTGGIGPIHIFSIMTIYSLPMGIWHARRGNIAAHRSAMIGPYIGLIVAGVLALMMPGRFLHQLIFG